MSRQSKIKTNEQAFRSLFAALKKHRLDTFLVALLRERVLTMMDITKKSIEQEPEKWENGFVHVDAYKELIEIVEKELGFHG